MKKQYFIGVNKRDDDLINGLFDLGALLMFYYWGFIKYGGLI